MDRRHVLGGSEEGIGPVPQIQGVSLASVGNRFEISRTWRFAKSLASRHEEEAEQNTGMKSYQIRIVFGVPKGTTDVV